MVWRAHRCNQAVAGQISSNSRAWEVETTGEVSRMTMSEWAVAEAEEDLVLATSAMERDIWPETVPILISGN